MASDSAFRRLLLDTVATVIAQPPSAASLVELLRIATPSLLAAASDDAQRQRADATVRDRARRENLFRRLKLRIHPDKHVGDERATALFQEVTSFYEKCVTATEREHLWEGVSRGKSGRSTTNYNKKESQESDDDEESASPDKTNERSDATSDGNKSPFSTSFPWWSQKDSQGSDEEGASPNKANERSDATSGWNKSPFPTSFPWWSHLHQRTQDPRRPTAAEEPAHADYENYDNNNQSRRQNNDLQPPAGHEGWIIVAAVLFPPLGLCAAYNAFRARRAWDEGRHHEARERAQLAHRCAYLGIACFAFLVFYHWLCFRDDDWGWDWDWDWDWEEMKEKWGWDDGP